MPVLVPLVTDPPTAFVDELRRVWRDGDAVLPVDHRLPLGAQKELCGALGAMEPVQAGDALVLATSGTTGAPRGVVLTHAAVEASAHATSTALGVDPACDTWLSVLPLAHVGGLSVITRALATGTPFTFDASDPRATLTSVVPTQLGRMDLTRMRRVLVGGSAWWGGLGVRPDNVVHTYGLTQTASGVVYDGAPLDGVSVRVDEEGQVWVRGPMLLRAYRDGPAPFDADGWLPTGDAGELGRDGKLTVFGRMGDVIVTGGEKVWPDAVESALRGSPGVREVAVAGRADDEWGRRVVAFVVPGLDGRVPTLDGLRARVKETLPAWCAPKELVLVDSLPRTPSGKVRRNALPGVPPSG